MSGLITARIAAPILQIFASLPLRGAAGGGLLLEVGDELTSAARKPARRCIRGRLRVRFWAESQRPLVAPGGHCCSCTALANSLRCAFEHLHEREPVEHKRTAAWAPVLLVVAALFGQPAVAWGCTPSPGWPEKIRVEPDLVARRMVRAAIYVDVAVAEEMTSDVDFATRSHQEWVGYAKSPAERAEAEENLRLSREMVSKGSAVRIHFRVVERLKAHGPDTFTINGENASAYRSGRSTSVRPVSLPELKYFLNQEDYADWAGPGVCTTQIYADVGQRYLVFRDRQGRISKTQVPVTFKEPIEISGPAVVPLAGDNDPWLLLVRKWVRAQ